MLWKKYWRVLAYIRPYWGFALLNVIFNLLVIFFSLFSFVMLVPFLNLLFGIEKLVEKPPEITFSPDDLLAYINYLISRIIISKGEVQALIFICLFLLGTFFLRNLFRFLAMFFMASVRIGAVRDIRDALYKKLLILPLSFYSKRKKGDIIARLTTDVQEVEISIMTYIEMIFRDPVTILAYFITLFVMSPQLTLFVLVILPVTGYIIGRIGRTLRKESKIGQERYGGLLAVIEETIGGLRIIKAFTAIDFTGKRFQKLNHEYSRTMTWIYRTRDLSSPLSEFLSSVVIIVVLWFGGRLVLSNDAEITAAVFITYIVIFSQIIPPAKTFATGFYSIQKGMASAERIFEVLDADEVIVEKENAIKLKEFEKEIEYRNVTFKYNDEPVLHNIQLVIPKGRLIALVGPSGSGKTTMVDLLPRFYDPTEGSILIDGHPLPDLHIDSLRSLMGIVGQEAILFNDTVFNNIAFGKSGVSEEDVINAAKVANAHEFIMEMEEGYQTNIGDRGTRLSGGQRQRLSIARAVLRNPPILILDEATSALDTESERLVQEALEKVMSNRTTIAIAHRLSTIQHADEIIVLDKGKIVERGTHNDLLEKGGLYKHLYDLQAFSA
ncbi:MAG: ABC transporter ATP-binding protein [Bacteroidales bacterium]